MQHYLVPVEESWIVTRITCIHQDADSAEEAAAQVEMWLRDKTAQETIADHPCADDHVDEAWREEHAPEVQTCDVVRMPDVVDPRQITLFPEETSDAG